MDLEAWAVHVRDLEEEGFMKPQAQAIDRGQIDLVVEGSGSRQEVLDLLHTEHGGEPVRDLRA
jgi:hypothetical protein